MSMEKYGVEDRRKLQQRELNRVDAELRTYDLILEKTASQQLEYERLNKRAEELREALREEANEDS